MGTKNSAISFAIFEGIWRMSWCLLVLFLEVDDWRCRQRLAKSSGWSRNLVARKAFPNLTKTHSELKQTAVSGRLTREFFETLAPRSFRWLCRYCAAFLSKSR